ncbi:MAG: Hpt domain-containing protein [Methylophilaceae bacterium]
MAEDFDIGPLTWVKDEINQALANVLENLDDVASHPDEVAKLKFSQTHLYQVSGALDMVGLEGCKRFCAEIEKLTGKLEKNQVAVTPETIAALKNAVKELGVYLQGLLDGLADQPLKLAPALQAMAAVQNETIGEIELFFPDTSIRAPKEAAMQDVPEDALPSYLADQRKVLLKSLLGWLRADNPEQRVANLDSLRGVLENVKQVQKQSSQRTFWWVATAFLDVLGESEFSENRYVKRLVRRLDQQLRSQADGSNRASGNLLRDLLYFIAVSRSESERIAQVRELFELEGHIPKPDSYMVDVLEISATELESIESLLSTLETLKDQWNSLSETRDIKLLDAFSYQVSEMFAASQHLTHQSIVDMLGSLYELSGEVSLDNSKLTDTVLIEVAAGLTVLEDALSRYAQLSENDIQDLDKQSQLLQEIASGEQNPDTSQNSMLENVGKGVNAAVVQQIKDALHIAEQSLDSFFRDTSTTDVLLSADKAIREVIAAFDMLDMPVPTATAQASLKLIGHFKQGESDQGLFIIVAESLSMLGFYTEELPRVRPESRAALESNLDKLEKQLELMEFDDAPIDDAETSAGLVIEEIDTDAFSEPAFIDTTSAEIEAATIVSEVAIPDESLALETEQAPEADRIDDAELLDIYLTESEEVLANIAQNLQALRVNATAKEALVEVRRGFHTLKGSGRTVGMKSTAEVAWAVEQLLNLLMERKTAPTAAQLAFVEDASAAFAGWTATLKDVGEVYLDYVPWQERAHALENEAVRQKPASEEVVIGGTYKISRGLFNIFMLEAEEHMQALNESVPEVKAQMLANEVKKPSDSSRRAAHTLASNAGTTGFKAIGVLSRELEFWLDEHQGYWTPQTFALYENVVSALGNMLRKAALLRQPKQVPSLVVALQEATAQASSIQPVAESVDVPLETPEAVLADIDASAELAESEVSATLEIAEADGLDAELSSEESLDANEDNIADVSEIETADAVLESPDGELSTAEPLAISLATDATAIEADLKASEDTPLDASLLAQTISEPISETQATVAEVYSNQDSVQNELLTMFVEEAHELLPVVGNELRAWRTDPTELSHSDELQRALHTLKGSARMVGQAELADTVHGMEDRVIRGLKSKTKKVDFDGLFGDLDQIGVFVDAATSSLTANSPLTAHQPQTENRALRPVERAVQYLRMRADVLDRLINEAGEISIARSRVEREMIAFKHFSLDLTESVQRLRGQLREMEIEAESQMQSRMAYLQETNETFDPLEFDRFTRLQELTRMMAESVNDVSTIQHGLLGNMDEAESALQQQNRMNRELQHGLMDVRMVPFSMVTERLQRIVRQTAKELEKEVELHIDGEAVDVDRSVLDKIGAPLEHLLRNAVAHGMETPAERKKAKKQTTGKVNLVVRRENDEIVMTVSDDGAGINLERVKSKAIENGLFSAEHEVSEQALMSVIFEPGFSTATDVTQISGRGVGLDSVRSDITALGGRIDVNNAVGQGAVFTIYLPVTLSVSQVVLVRAGTNVFALPSVMVEQAQKIKADDLAKATEQGHVEWSGRDYPLYYLNKLIGDNEQIAEEHRYTPVLLLRSGTYHIALHVDEIVNNQEVVMKPIGAQLSRVPGIIGATVMGDGKVVLIINPVQLANREVLAVGNIRVSNAPVVKVDVNPTILVVDDSLTMRKVLSRLLERENYKVLLAKDGMDALQVLQENLPDVIITDIEMPRMDGFELVRNIKGDERTASIPLMIISSRTAEKHQNHAKELGVDAFLGKPVQDDELITQVSILLGSSVPVSA